MTTDQRCAVPTCGHPEANHVCEDEGINAQPYHGDDWCELCPTGPHEYKPPAPDSSLEEARERVRDTRKWLEECIADRGTALDVGHTSALDDFEDAVEAAARAEVIRDVEALAEDAQTLAIMLATPKTARTEGYEDIRDLRAHAATLARRLRALSQGGEANG